MDQPSRAAARLKARSRISAGMDAVLLLAGIAAIGALVGEYGGFTLSQQQLDWLHIVQLSVVVIFVVDRLVLLAISRPRLVFLRENWVDFALLVAAVIAVAISLQLRTRVLRLGTIYVIITQAYIVASLLIKAVYVNLRFAGSGVHPSYLLLGSFLLMCLVGAGLLMLPRATPPDSPISFNDAIFTATSATCVTGLVVRDTGADFTPFGQGVILVLIQLGGLGIMLFGTMLAVLVGKGLSVRTSSAIGQMISADGLGRLGRMILFVLIVTVAAELLGAVMLYPMFAEAQVNRPVGSPAGAAWYSVFHSISSFCNAGFSLYGANMMAGVSEGWQSPLRDRWGIYCVMAPLIVLGGLTYSAGLIAA